MVVPHWRYSVSPLASRIASQRLDRSKPLWESWIVEGLQPDKESEQERFALIFKTHHALVDGISGVDLATVLFDLTPEPPAVAADVEPWHPRPEPSPAELLATTLLLLDCRDDGGFATAICPLAYLRGYEFLKGGGQFYGIGRHCRSSIGDRRTSSNQKIGTVAKT